MKVSRFGAMEGVYLLTPQILHDQRGRLMSSYDYDQLQDICGLETPFIHSDVYYLVAKGLAGLYYQEVNPRASLYRCIFGKAQVVAVDLRKDSKTYGKYQQVLLNSDNCLSFLAKPGFATGCIGIGGSTIVVVDHTTRNILEDQKVLKWDEPQVGIVWASAGPPTLGTRERMGLPLAEIKPYEI